VVVEPLQRIVADSPQEHLPVVWNVVVAQLMGDGETNSRPIMAAGKWMVVDGKSSNLGEILDTPVKILAESSLHQLDSLLGCHALQIGRRPCLLERRQNFIG
jgi:hypothetical protein